MKMVKFKIALLEILKEHDEQQKHYLQRLEKFEELVWEQRKMFMNN